ncbi:MAG: S8 family serine peptidase [Candidatus Kapabacteria bacterium]|nr:S8 family serine peptidase [Candidatus Kapabacteria bacterium]
MKHSSNGAFSRLWQKAVCGAFLLVFALNGAAWKAHAQVYSEQNDRSPEQSTSVQPRAEQSAAQQAATTKRSAAKSSVISREEAAIQSSLRRLVSGKALGNGMFSLAKAPRRMPLKEGTYEKGAIYVKTRERFPVGKGSTSFQSSVLMRGLEGVVVREIRPVSQAHNSGALLTSDDFGVGRIYTVRFDPGVDVQRLCAELSQNPEVEYAEPIYIYQLQQQDRVTPNDPLFARQYHWARIEAERAWGITRGDSTIVIAICDSGVDIEHEDLRGNIWTNPGESGMDAMGRDRRTNGVDDDNNGKIDDWRGWDFIGNTTPQDRAASILRPDNDPRPRPLRDLDTQDGLNHGSHVAGIAGSTADNRTGGLGSGYRCRILPIKNATEDFPNSQSVLSGYEGILYAAQMGAHIVNCSWGGPGGFSQVAQDFINTATGMGTLVVAAAGNAASLMDDGYFPASFDNVMSVGASDENDTPAGFSNFGVKTSVFAPGDNILSTVINNQYVLYGGTSMASPMAAGIAGLVRHLHPDWTPQQIVQQIRGTSENVLVPGAAARPFNYFGRMNAFRALNINRTINGAGETMPGIITAGNSIDAVNGLITSFEPKRLVLSVRNILSDASDVSVTLTPLDPNIVAIQPTMNIGNLAGGQRKDVEFTIQLQSGALASAGLLDISDFVITYRSGSYINYELLTVPYQLPASNSTPQLVVSPVTNFGTTPIATTASVRITNTGNQTIRVTAATQAFTGANAGEFSQVDALTGFDLVAGASTTSQIRFTPTQGSSGQRTAAFNVVGMSNGVVPTTGAGTPIASGYTFSQRQETYTEIQDNNFPFAMGGANLDDAEFDVDLPFPFQFGQTTYTNARIVSNGFLAFRPARSSILDNAFVTTPIGDASYGAEGIISGFTLDLYMLQDGTIRYGTQGTAPNRVFTVQWKRASFVTNTGVSPDADLNFQIRLYEGSNRIEFAYDRMSFTRDGFLIRGQVGLRGRTPADFNNRLVNFTAHNWLTSVTGSAPTDRCDLFPEIAPPSGLVYVYTPGDFAATSSPRVTAFQRSTELRATARSGGVLMTTPPLTTGVSFNTVNRIGGAVVASIPTTIGTTRIETVTMANISANPLTITSLDIVPVVDATAGEFRVLSQVPITIPPNAVREVQVAFSPSVNRFREAALRIGYDGVTAVMPLLGGVQGATDVLRFFNDVGTDLTGTPGFFSRFDRLPPFSLTGALPPINLAPIGTTRIVELISIRNMGTQPVTVTGATFTQATLASVVSREFRLLTPLPFTVQPGTSQTLSIAYSPIDAGEKLVDFRLFSNTAAPAVLRCGSVGGVPRAIQVTPRGTNDVVNTSPIAYNVSFGLVPINTTATRNITLRNSSTASMRISGVSFGGVNGSEYSVNTFFPINVAAAQTTTLTVTFRPQDVGVRTGVMTLFHNQAPESESIELIGSGDALRRLAVPLFTQIFNQTAPNATSSTIAIGLRNAGRQTVTVASVTIEGRDANQFRFLRSIPNGTTIATAVTSTATVFFAPTSRGVKEARLIVRNNGDFPYMTVELRGTSSDSVARATIATLDASAQFGDEISVPIILRNGRSLPANTTIYANLRLNASMLQPLDAASTGIVTDNQRVVRLTLTPNGTDTVLTRLRYRAVLGNDTTTVLRLEEAFATNATISAVSGRLTITGAPQAFLQVAAGQRNAQYSAAPGGTVSMPIVVRNRHRIPAGRNLIATMTYNASLLEPTNLTMFAASNSVAGGIRTIVFAIPPGTAEDLVITPTFRAAVGNSTGSTVTMQNSIRSVDPIFGDLQFLQPSGSFALTNLNRAGGNQLFFSPRASLVIVQSSPNPATEAVSVTFRTIDDGNVTVSLADASGKTLYEEQLSALKAGEHTLRLPTSTLPTGSYLLTLRSASGKATQTLQIVR